MNDRETKGISQYSKVWQNLKRSLELKIIDGSYASGSQIPSLSQLTEIYGISRSTVQRALEELCVDGILHAINGVGYFVKPYTKDTLLTAHSEALTRLLSNDATYGIEIGMSKDDLMELFSTACDNALKVKDTDT